MEPAEYKAMFDLEEAHWWCRGLRDLALANVHRFFHKKNKPRILDAGCGVGATLKGLNRYGEAVGIDISDEALKYCEKRGLRRILKASVARIPFREGAFDLVVSNDVLCHKLVVNDEEVLREIYRILKKGGLFITNLPAHDYLKRGHDEAVHTKHRYTKNELRVKLENNNFKIIKITYRSALLWPAVLIASRISKKDARADSDLGPLNSVMNSVFYRVLSAENWLLKFINMPLGTSVFCVARKL